MFKNTLYHLSPVKKITLAALFMALVVIFNKVIAINYIPVIPFARISFGSIAILIFSSIVLGPLYGLVIGACGDLIGYFVFDMSSFGWFFQITLIYALLGFLPYFVYQLVRKLKNEKIMMIVEYSFLAVLCVLISLFFIFNNSLKLYSTTYEFSLFQRIFIPCLVVLLCALIVVVNFIIKKKVSIPENGLNIYQISFIVFICEVLVNFLFGSLMKGWAFGFDTYVAIIFTQAVIMFFNIPYNTYLIFVIIKISDRFLKKETYVD